MKISRAWVALVFAACGGDGDEVETTEAPVLSPTTPYAGPSVALPSYYPALAGHGRLAEAHWSQTSILDAHSVRFTDGVNLRSPPATDACWDETERGTWISTLDTPVNAAYLQSPELATHLGEALVYADGKLAQLDASVLELADDVFDMIPNFHSDTLDERHRFSTWTTPRARWIDSQWHPTLHPAPAYPETHYLYPTPSGLAALPQRGARLYCAAREMARQQKGGSLGEQVLLPLRILGQPIDIGVVEASAFVDQPEKFVGAVNDGSQAFSIPLALGTKITPVRPMLPSLPEIRYPLVLSTADSEIVTDTGRELIYEDKRCFAFFCIPVIRPDFRVRYKTLSHVDTAQSTSQAMTAGAKIPLFYAGAALVELGLVFNAGVGRAAPPIGSAVDTCSTPDSVTRPQVSDDRVLEITPAPAGWPAAIRIGNTSGDYLDGPWNLNTAYISGSPVTRPFNVRSIDGPSSSIVATIPLEPSNPLSTSVLADDDHHLRPTAELGIAGGLIGTFGLSAGIATIAIVAEGTVRGTLGLAHDVRDAVVATTASGSANPISALTITPVGYGDASILFKVTFSLHIDLWIGSIDVSYVLLDESTPIASFERPWGEDHRMRIGTSSVGGDPTWQPDVMSHHGARAPFQSFPPGNSVEACLADPLASPPPPPRCESTPATPGIPRIDNCLYITLQSDELCANIPVEPVGYSQQCAAAKLTYMCNPVSKIQDFKGEHVLAHVMNFSSANISDLDAIGKMIELCARADESSITPTDAGVTAWFENQFRIGACDASATLVDKADVITVGGPSDVGPGTCPPVP